MKGLINKEVSVVTILTISLYGFSYVFQRAYSNFWGYPTEFISVDLNMMLKTTIAIFVIVFMIFSLVTYLYNSPGFGLPFGFLWGGVIYVFFMWGNAGFESIFFNSNDMAGMLRFPVLGFSFSIVFMLYILAKIKKTEDKKEKIDKGIVFLGALYIFAYSTAWLYASLNDELYYNESNYYLVSSYGDFYILGKCINNKAEFLKVSSTTGYYKKSDRGDVLMIKKCFRDAS
ncbi:hypothetical protein ACTVPB_03070 [Serratia marcescens]|uniref:hypothetical protein n=1 Tax=Serratia marcescens TaxID=615 RepID=UPI003FA6AE5A